MLEVAITALQRLLDMEEEGVGKARSDRREC